MKTNIKRFGLRPRPMETLTRLDDLCSAASKIRCIVTASFCTLLLGSITSQGSAESRNEAVSVHVDNITFLRINRRRDEIIGTLPNGDAIAIRLAAKNIRILGLSGRVEDIKPGDEVGVRSTFDESKQVVASELIVNVHTFNAEVLSKSRRSFQFRMVDYYTGVPLDGLKATGVAVLLPGAVIKIEAKQRGNDSPQSRIIVRDKVKMYGFQHANSSNIEVYRLEDRGNR